jgi:group I intron endonuclease
VITYRATNTLNGKFYIGSTTNFENRKRGHLKSVKNWPFQNALRSNPEAFEWETWEDNDENPTLEQALLDIWFGKGQCYNLNPYANRPIGMKGRFGPDHPKYGIIESEETRKKKSIAHTGKPKSLSHKEKLQKNLKKLADSRRGQPGRKHSSDEILKMRESLKNQKRFRCTITGFETTGGALTRYQKARGIHPSNRIQII